MEELWSGVSNSFCRPAHSVGRFWSRRDKKGSRMTEKQEFQKEKTVKFWARQGSWTLREQALQEKYPPPQPHRGGKAGVKEVGVGLGAKEWVAPQWGMSVGSSYWGCRGIP